MTHERAPPDGYIEALRPNVQLDGDRVVIAPRTPPMTAADVRAIESAWRRRTLQ